MKKYVYQIHKELFLIEKERERERQKIEADKLRNEKRLMKIRSNIRV